jgi:hypothetical protein
MALPAPLALVRRDDGMGTRMHMVGERVTVIEAHAQADGLAETVQPLGGHFIPGPNPSDRAPGVLTLARNSLFPQGTAAACSDPREWRS